MQSADTLVVAFGRCGRKVVFVDFIPQRSFGGRSEDQFCPVAPSICHDLARTLARYTSPWRIQSKVPLKEKVAY